MTPRGAGRSHESLAQLETAIRAAPRSWLVTGAAGFIGSHLVERLLSLGQEVVGLDNFATGSARNLEEALAGSPSAARQRFILIEGDIRDLATCRAAMRGVAYVLHQAALSSVPRSLRDPVTTHEVNVDGFVNVLVAARDEHVERFVYASSSSVYGGDTRPPHVVGGEVRPRSPYAATKVANELYASAFQTSYGLPTVGLRYFNVFGPRQDIDGPYAAVIPRWVRALARGEPPRVFGDGETTRDFCYVANAVQANLLAAHSADAATGRSYDVGYGAATSLNFLCTELRGRVRRLRPNAALRDPVYEPFREGDVRHSRASLADAGTHLGYAPTHSLARGLDEAMPWYMARVD